MKKKLSFFMVVIMLASMTSLFVSANQVREVGQNVLILYKDQVQPSDLLQLQSLGGEVKREYRNFPIVLAEMPAQAIRGLENNPNIEVIEPDGVVSISNQVKDWGIDTVGGPAAWSAGLKGNGIKVAVIDTGIATHPDLVISGGRSFVSYTTSFNDDNGHGTHVAGIIGARDNGFGYVGIAPESSLYAVKVLDSAGSGFWSSVISGIDWSVTNDMDIINMSLGGNSGSSTMEAAINTAVANGTLVFAAAGNDGTSAGDTDSVDFPARYTNAIAVASTTTSNVRSSFSSTGPAVDVAAPGSGVASTYLNNGYATLSGTSMATPYAAGVMALIKQANPTASVTELRNLLQTTATDLGVAGVDSWYGHGLVKAPSTPPPPPAPDTQAPTVPVISGVSNLTSTSLTLNWTASTDNQAVAGYEVFQDGSSVGTVNGTTTSFGVTGLTASTTYGFTVRAFDAAANYSEQSTPFSSTTAAPPDTQAPTVPVISGVTNITATSLTLNWGASTDNVAVTGYEVFRNGTSIATVSGTTTSLNVSGLTAATTYSFTVRAFDAAGNLSAQSTPFSATTTQPPGIATTTTVVMAKTSYTAGNTVSGTVTVRDSSGRTVSGATVQVVVNAPNGSLFTTVTGSTNSRGTFSFKFNTASGNARGTYSVVATSARSGFTSSSGTATFTLR